MTFLLGLLGRWGVPPEFRRVILGLLGILLVIIVVGGGKCAYDKSIITNHDAKVEASAAKADRKADETAALQRRTDDARIAQEQNELKKAVTYAPNDPAVDDNLERKRAFYRCLRLQQAARANGGQPPSC